jgi:site-specific recombinase XerC
VQQFFRWLDGEGEIDASPMAKMRPPIVPEQPVPVLPDDHIKRLLDSCADRDFRSRRDLAILRLFVDTGIRLEGMGRLRYDVADADLSDGDLRGGVVRVVAKGRREMVLPIGNKAARDIDRYLRLRAAHPRIDLPWLWLDPKGRLTPLDLIPSAQ